MMASVEHNEAHSSNGTSSVKLKIGIIGAGIAGLAAAITLKDAGHEVEIYERSRFAQEIGAGIHVTPNASKVLLSHGFDFEAARASDADEMAYLSAETGEVLRSVKYPDCQQKYGSRWVLFHRADLHSELKRQATELRDAKLRLQTAVQNVNADGTIRLASGETIHKDLVVIANGIHSDFVEPVAGAKPEIDPAGTAMTRFLVPMEEVANNAQTRPLAEAGMHRFLYCMKDRRNFVSYPCKGGTMANSAMFAPDDLDWQGAWSQPATKEDLLKACEGYNSAIVGLCDMAKDISTWRLAIRKEPVQTLVRDRLVLVGDAAHPMLPFLGQGGAMAIEDAEALGVLMSSLSSPADVPDRLTVFQEIRKDRVCAMQLLSNWGVQGYDKVFADARPFFKHEKLPVDRDELNEWCFDRDIKRETADALAKYTKVT